MVPGVPVTPEQWEKFLEIVATGVGFATAAKQCGFSRSTVYNHKERDEEFARRLDEAVESSVDELETKAFALANAGETDMLRFMLRARRRDVYGDKVSVDGSMRGPMSDIELAAKAAALFAAGGIKLNDLVKEQQGGSTDG